MERYDELFDVQKSVTEGAGIKTVPISSITSFGNPVSSLAVQARLEYGSTTTDSSLIKSHECSNEIHMSGLLNNELLNKLIKNNVGEFYNRDSVLSKLLLEENSINKDFIEKSRAMFGHVMSIINNCNRFTFDTEIDKCDLGEREFRFVSTLVYLYTGYRFEIMSKEHTVIYKRDYGYRSKELMFELKDSLTREKLQVILRLFGLDYLLFRMKPEELYHILGMIYMATCMIENNYFYYVIEYDETLFTKIDFFTFFSFVEMSFGKYYTLEYLTLPNEMNDLYALGTMSKVGIFGRLDANSASASELKNKIYNVASTYFKDVEELKQMIASIKDVSNFYEV